MRLDLATHYPIVLERTEARTDALVSSQLTDGNDLEKGGFRDPSTGLVNPGSSIGALVTLIPALVAPDSRHHGSKSVADTTQRVLDFAHRVQHDDGTFDLLTTNFHSSPDNGFIMQNLARCYRALLTGDHHAGIRESLYDLIVKTGDGMIGHGFHTPNHRWVISAALAMTHSIVSADDDDSTYLEEARRYLAEGIDVDENGEFTERSSGIYNAINDNALIILSDELGDESLLDPVVANLEMMFSYIEPDGSLFTWNSTRQDKGEGAEGKRFFPGSYYAIYVAMLTRRFDPRYAWMAEKIFEQTRSSGGSGGMLQFVVDPSLKDASFEAEPPASESVRHFVPSGIVRIRRNDISATVLANSSSFLFFQAGSIRCRVKLCASFFAVAQFRADRIEEKDGRYHMEFESSGDYRLPLDPPPESSMWREMNHSRRVHVQEQRLGYHVEVGEIKDGIELSVRTEGCERVPVKLEFIVSSGSVVSGDGFVMPARPGGSVTVKSGDVNVAQGADAMKIGPACGSHWFGESMRGSEPQAPQEQTIYFTGYTPFEHRISISRVSPGSI